MTKIEIDIWNYIYGKLPNPYAVAAIMGNLYAESSLNPLTMTGKKKSQWISSFEYITAVNIGSYDQYSFAHDGIAFGLVQWTYWSRKQALHEFAKGRDIGSMETQIDFMFAELPKYKTVWNALQNATEINSVCDIFMLKYEKPGTTTEAAKESRRAKAAAYFDMFAHKEKNESSKQEVPKTKYVSTTVNNVLIRSGNGRQFPTVGRINLSGYMSKWVATSEDGWHAIEMKDRVGWISGEFAEIKEV